jgi:L-amino acid N-acyltransferase YncA
VSRLHVQMAPPEHFGWLLSRTGGCATHCFRALEAVDAKGQIKGMVGYDCWTPNSVQISVALDSPVVARSLLRRAFQYPFVECNRQMLWAVISSRNSEALKLDAHLGFVETHRIREGHSPGIDLVLMEMRRADCRWLRPEEKHHAS